MAQVVEAATVKAWLSEPTEIAFADVREAGQFGEGHPFFAVPLPYSVFEARLPLLAPNRAVRLVLIDDGDGVAEKAARRAEGLGFANVHTVRGGVGAWQAAGYTLFRGVNLPSKTFGEIVEMERHTPRVSAAELKRMQAAGADIVIVDGRPFSEYQKMNIPGGVCCPNGELALRIAALVPREDTTIVVNCAGRTRSIIGAETLRAAGVRNKVVALENGTQGWFLAGLELERGANRRHGLDVPTGEGLSALRERARSIAKQCGAGFVSANEVAAWLTDPSRTTFVLDVRTPEEHAQTPIPSAVPAPGGQLIQATDQWVGVKGARLVLVDGGDGVRAPMVAHWLAQLGHETHVLEGGAGAARALPAIGRPTAGADLAEVAAGHVSAALAAGARVIDVGPSGDFRRGHIAGASWSIRPRIAAAARGAARVLLAGPREEARLAAIELAEAGTGQVEYISGGPEAWAAAGMKVVADASTPPDQERIDFLFFVHDRHEGNEEAARQYLAWETGLLAQLDAQERGVFRVARLAHP